MDGGDTRGLPPIAPLPTLSPFPKGAGRLGVKAKQTMTRRQSRRVNSEQCLYLPLCLGHTTVCSWGPARLAYCLALFAFGAMGALSGSD